MKLPDSYSAWRHPAFTWFLWGRVFFLAGTAAQGLAIGWDMYQRTRDPFALGLVALAKGVPIFVFTLPAGYLADRFDRRRVMGLAMVGATLTSLALAWVSWRAGALWSMYLLLFLDSSFARIAAPSGAAITPQLVPREHLENAVKWRSNLFHLTSLLGPALGGLILTWNVQAAYLFCAATSAWFIFVLTRVDVPPAARAPVGRMLAQVAEGLRFVWHRKVVLGAVSLDLFAVLFGGAVYLLPVFAQDILTVLPRGMRPEQALGWLLAAPAAGSLLMGVILAHRPPLRHAGRAMLLGVFGFGLATIGFGFSTNFWLSWAMLFLTGFCDNISVVVRHTLVQLVTPNEMRGRVSAVNSLFIGSSNELGGFESGLVAKWTNPLVSVVSGGLATLLVVVAWAKLFPRLRDFGSLADVRESDG